jgi:hypothetical protein
VKHAIVENGTVVNVVEWDVVSPWSPGPDQQAIASDTARVGDSYVGGAFVSPARPEQPVTVIDIMHERSRRLALGFDYNFGDVRGVHHIGTSPADMVGWGEVSTYAGALLDMGDVTTTIDIVTDTGPCQVTAPEWRAIEVAAAAFRQPIWACSFVLSQSLPTDYMSDAHWK